jgi:hypothetical protein
MCCGEGTDSKGGIQACSVQGDRCGQAIGVGPCLQVYWGAICHGSNHNETIILVFLVQSFQLWCTCSATASTEAGVLDEHSVVTEIVQPDFLSILVEQRHVVDDIALGHAGGLQIIAA